MEYWKGINQGDDYMCDRCNVVKLKVDEYYGNHNPDTGNRYCNECTTYIILRKWECNKCHSSGTMRNERLLPKVCCKQEVSWLK